MRARLLGLFGFFGVLALPSAAGAVRLAERNVDGDWGPAYLDLIGFLQPRIEFVQDDTRCPGIRTTCRPEERVTEHDFGGDGFRLRRARLGFAGRLHEVLAFQTQVELADAGRAELYDAYLDFPFDPVLSIRFGQFKVPFSREALVPISRLQFVEPSLLFAGGLADRNPSHLGVPDRDVGLMLTSGFGDGTLVEVMAGLFNGDGVNTLGNGDDGKLFAVRLAVHPFGAPGRLEESDVAREEDPRLSIAFDFSTNARGGEGSPSDVDEAGLPMRSYEERTNLVGGDLAFFWEGASLYGELLLRSWSSADPVVDDQTGFGFVLQGGYLLPFEDLDRHVELAFRYDQYDPIRCTNFGCDDGNVAPPTDPKDPLLGRRTYTIGTNFFFTGDHTWKLQLNYVRVAEMERASTVVEGLHDDAFLIQMTAHL